MINIENELNKAKRALDVAQANYEDLVLEAGRLEEFGKPTTHFMVIAKSPTYNQFVSYPLEGEVVATFSDEAAAQKYAKTVRAPTGTDLLVEEVQHYSSPSPA